MPFSFNKSESKSSSSISSGAFQKSSSINRSVGPSVTHSQSRLSMENKEDSKRNSIQQNDIYAPYYQYFPRLFDRDPILLRILMYLDVNSCRTLLSSKRLFWLNTSASPMHDEKIISKALRATRFTTGAGFITNTIWPLSLLTLLIYDINRLSSTEQFGDRFRNIILGTGTNQATLSSSLGSILAGDYRYWLGLVALVFSPIIAGLFKLIKRKLPLTKLTNRLEYYANNVNFWRDTFQPWLPLVGRYDAIEAAEFLVLWDATQHFRDGQSYSFETLIESINQVATYHYTFTRWRAMRALANIADAFMKPYLPKQAHSITPSKLKAGQDALSKLEKHAESNLYAKYNLWAINRLPHTPLTSLFSLYLTYQVYASFRRAELIIQKSKGLYEYYQAKADCGARNRTYTLTQIGDYECLACDDPEISYFDQHTPQGCLNGLLARPQSASRILDFQIELAKQAEFKNISHIDLSKQNWISWDESQLNRFFTSFENALHQLHTLNLSYTEPDTYWPIDNKAIRVGELLQKINVFNVDLHNLNMGAKRLRQIFTPSYNASTRWLDLSGNILGDESELASILHQHPQLETLHIANNQITDPGMKPIIMATNATTMSTINVADNPITTQSIGSLAKASETSALRHIDYSKIPISAESMQTIGAHLPTLHSLCLRNCQLDNIVMQAFIPYVQDSNVTKYDFSYNQIDDEVVCNLLSSFPKDLVQELKLRSTAITDDAFTLCADHLEKITIHLDISENGLTAKFLNVLLPQATHLVELSAEDNNFRDKGAFVIADMFFKHNYTLQNINIARNQIGPVAGMAVLQVTPHTQLRRINLASNPLTSNALETSLPWLKQLNTLDISETNTTTITQLVENLAAENVTLQRLYLSRNHLPNSGLLFAKTLIKPAPFDLKQITKQEIDIDQQRLLARADRRTPITEISLDNSDLMVDDIGALCRISIPAQLTMENLHLAPNAKAGNLFDLANCQVASNTLLSGSIKGGAALLSKHLLPAILAPNATHHATSSTTAITTPTEKNQNSPWFLLLFAVGSGILLLLLIKKLYNATTAQANLSDAVLPWRRISAVPTTHHYARVGAFAESRATQLIDVKDEINHSHVSTVTSIATV